MSDNLILVDKDDKEIGSAEKEECHKSMRLHRAFSIFIFNSSGELLIHKRSSHKKTWPGFWTNSCCSHPRVGEELEKSAERRLKEELGFSCPLQHLFSFQYQAKFDGVYGEHELDHVFIGTYDGPVEPDKDEVEQWLFINVDDLKRDIKKNPEKYTPWFKLCIDGVLQRMEKSL